MVGVSHLMCIIQALQAIHMPHKQEAGRLMKR